MKIKKIILLSSLAPVSMIAPAIALSCSFNIAKGDLSLEEQIKVLTSEEAKKLVLDNWLTETFIALLFENGVIANENSKPTSEQKRELGVFLQTFKWETNSSFDAATKTKIEAKVVDAYNFYITYKSTVPVNSGGEGEESSSPSLVPAYKYFYDKSIEWKSKKYRSVDGLTFSTFNPKIGPMTEATNVNDENFQMLMKIRPAGVYADVLKLMITDIFFNHANEKQISNGTNINKQISKPYTQKWLDAKSFKTDSKDYFLLKYLVSNSPTIQWQYSSTKEPNIQQIKTLANFNDLSKTDGVTLNELLAPTTPDNSALVANIENFNSIKINTSSETELAGDLALGINAIKTFSNEKVGLLYKNPKNSETTLQSFASLAAMEEIQKTPNNYTLPKVTLPNPNNVTLIDIKKDDIKLEGVGTTNGQKAEVLAVIPIEEKDDEFSAKVNMKYTFTSTTGGTSKENNLYYSFTLKWGEKNVDSPFNETFNFGNFGSDVYSLFPSSISAQTDSNGSEASYYLRILPLFIDKGKNINIDGKVQMTGHFSLKGTVWNTEPQKQKLAFLFAMADSNLWNKIQDYLLFNKFEIESKNEQLNQIISELKLTPKTDKDRKAAGIL